jgi:hypothetical protein
MNDGKRENVEEFPFVLSSPVLSKIEGSKHETPFSATCLLDLFG